MPQDAVSWITPRRLYLVFVVSVIIAACSVGQSMMGRLSVQLFGDDQGGSASLLEPVILNRKHNHTATNITGDSLHQLPESTPVVPSWATLAEPYLNETRLLQTGHFDRIAASLARAYPDRNSPEICTLRRLERAPKNSTYAYLQPVEGLFYNKVPKAASSTLAGINLRIALHWGHRLHAAGSPGNTTLGWDTACTRKQAHVIGAGHYYGNRAPQQSFLWGSIRDPAARALSRIYFYHISQAGLPDIDRMILKLLQKAFNPQSGTVTKGKGGFQLCYLTLEPELEDWFFYRRRFPTIVQRIDVLQERVRNVIQQYDFLAVTERMDESIVALQLILGLRMGDVLSASSAKTGGSFYFQAKPDRCIPIQKTKRSPAVNEYLESDEFQAWQAGDYLLYAAANQSLDLTIHRLGKKRFDRALQMYRDAQRIIGEECASQTYLPCSDNGTVQIALSASNCYSNDEGCGYACIDRLVQERGW